VLFERMVIFLGGYQNFRSAHGKPRKHTVGPVVEVVLSVDMEIGSLLSNAPSGTLRAANGNAGLPQGSALLVLGRWLLNCSCI